jgi:hypothetical protein
MKTKMSQNNAMLMDQMGEEIYNQGTQKVQVLKSNKVLMEEQKQKQKQK